MGSETGAEMGVGVGGGLSFLGDPCGDSFSVDFFLSSAVGD